MSHRYREISMWLKETDHPDFRFRQILDSVFRNRIGRFADMTSLPLRLRDELAERYDESILVLKPLVSTEGNQAIKTLFQLPDGHRVEAVAMKYQEGWESFCISSQSGCGFRCSFCATGMIGLKRNLTATEITDQVLHYHLLGHKIDSISFMGMGEALANPSVFEAIDIFTDHDLFGLGPRRLTISTIGIVPAIKRLTLEYPQVNLTFSLHSPFESQRTQLIPLNAKYPIDAVMDTLDRHIRVTNRKVYIAYLLIEGENDSDDHADGIVNLLRNRRDTWHLYHVNLIRYNPAFGVTDAYERPSTARVNHFCQRLSDNNISVTIRQSFGIESNAACGQLFAQYDTKQRGV